MAVGGVELAEPADRVSVVVRDSSGIAVKTIELGGRDAGSHAFAWDGSTDAGTLAADGAYTIAVSAQRGDAKLSATALQMGVVSSVSRTSQGINLNVGTLGAFRMSDVRQIL
jgi:flagellar basal-body rod modification protein FlgD